MSKGVLSVGVWLMMVVCSPASLTNGLVMWLTLDEGAGTNVADSSGSEHAGQAVSPGWISGVYSNALQFDGASSALTVSDFSYGPDFSVSFWFSATNHAGSNQDLFGHGSWASANSMVLRLYNSGAVVGNADQMRLNILDGNDAGPAAMDVDAVTEGLLDGAWHLYTLVVSNGNGSKVYIDGVEKSTGINGGDSINPAGTWYFGRSSSGNYFGGKLDDIRLYDRALSDTEVVLLSEGPAVNTNTVSLLLTNIDHTVVSHTVMYPVSGTSSNLTGLIAWSNSLSGISSGVAASSNWGPAWVELEIGTNTIKVSGTNNAYAVAVTVKVVRTVFDTSTRSKQFWDTEIKFNPGHYMLAVAVTGSINEIDAAQRSGFLDTNIVGVQKRYYWGELESSMGAYDFSDIEKDLGWCATNNRQLVLLLNDKVFFSYQPEPAPAYIETLYDGIYEQIGEVRTVKRWKPEVYVHYVNLVEALGERFDSHPNLEAVCFQETSIGDLSAPDSEYSDPDYYNNWLRMMQVARASFPRSQVIFFVNGWPSLSGLKKYKNPNVFKGLGAMLSEIGGVIGGPDILPYSPTFQYSEIYDPHTNRILSAISAQYDSYRQYTDGSNDGSGGGVLVSMEGIFSFAYSRLQSDYIFWRWNDGATTPFDFNNDTAPVLAKYASIFPRTYLTNAVMPAPAIYSPLDDLQGSLIPDESGFGRDGTLSNGGPYIVTGRYEGALQLTNTDDAVIYPDVDYGTNVSLTLSFWFKMPDYSPGTGRQVLFHHGSPTNNVELFLLESSNVLRTVFNSITNDVSGFNTYADNQWHHYGLSANYKHASVYLDGVFQWMATLWEDFVPGTTPNYNHQFFVVDPVGAIYVGRDPDESGTDYHGSLDDIRIYSRALTYSEINALYEAPYSPALDFTSFETASFSWERVNTNLNGFVIERQTGPDSWTATAAPANTASNLLLTGLIETNTYYYRIRKAGGAEALSDWTVHKLEAQDEDADQMADWWEQLYFGSVTNSAGETDTDGDSMVDRDEYLAGSIPTNVTSVLQLTNAWVQAGGGYVIQWPSADQRRYDVERLTGLISAQADIAASNIAASPPANTYTDQTATAETVFYLIRARR